MVIRISEVDAKTHSNKSQKRERGHVAPSVPAARGERARVFINEGPTNDRRPSFNGLLTNQCQDHAAGDVSDENYDQRRDYGEGDTPLRIRRLLAGRGYYVEANEGVETRRRAGENL